MTALLLLAAAIFAAPVRAETNLLTNPVLTPGNGPGTLPTGWAHQGWAPDGPVNHLMRPCPDPYLCASYAYGIDADGQPYLDVTLNNTSSVYAYTNLFFDHSYAASASDSYRLSIVAKVVTANAPATIGLGFHLYDTQGYVSETASDYGQQLSGGAELALVHHYQSGAPFGSTGRIPTQVQPRLGIYLVPHALLQIRIKAPLLTNSIHLSSVGIDARTGLTRRISAAPGKVLKFTAGLQGRPGVQANSVVSLVSSNATLSFNHLVASADPNLPDAWQVRLPSDIRLGDYSIRYALRDNATGMPITLQPNADVVVVSALGGAPVYEIGHLDVNSLAGLAIGQHFHGHPGRIGGDSRGTDPILVPYHFVRSHDSENVGGNSWWIEDTLTHNPDGKFDWTEFDRWANFHSAPGGSKLLITFYGSPTWASSKPYEASPYGIPGLSAPPKNRVSYQNMVKTTVTRYRGRIFATECWNEPGSTPGGYYTGTGTQLADICKAIYLSTKAVDANIPVICPATSDFDWLLTQRTSQGEPMHQFCDWVGAHPYNATGTDLAGADYSLDKLGEFVELLEVKLKRLGLQKPIALTEWGMFCDDRPAPAHSTHFHDMDSLSRGDLLYQMLGKAMEKGVVALGLYSYDSGGAVSASTGATCRYGYEGIGSVGPTGVYSYDALTAQGVTQAVRDFGKAPLP